MKSIATVAARRSIIATLSTLTFATAIIVFAVQFYTPTVRRAAATGLATVTQSHSDDLPNYDIRTDAGALERLAEYRQLQNRAASEVTDIRGRFVLGEKALSRQVPTLKIVYNSDIKIP